MTNRPTMHDPDAKEIHTANGVEPYPAPNRSDAASNEQDDEETSVPDNSFERGLDKDGNYRDAVDEMKKTLKDDGDLAAWKKGRTQN